MMHGIPLNLQFFADGGEGTGTDPQPAPTQGEPTNPQPGAGTNSQEGANAASITPEQLADILTRAVDQRTQRAERSTVRSIAEQYGMQESELTAILEQEKAKKQQAEPGALQQRLDALQETMNTRLMNAEVRAVGLSMGLRSLDDALVLMDKSKVKVEEDGTVKGVEDALKALKESKPYLFDDAKPGAWGMPVEQYSPAPTIARELSRRHNTERYGSQG